MWPARCAKRRRGHGRRGHDAVSAQDHLLLLGRLFSGRIRAVAHRRRTHSDRAGVRADRRLERRHRRLGARRHFRGDHRRGLPHRHHRSQEDVHHRPGSDRAVLISERIRCRGLAARGRPLLHRRVRRRRLSHRDFAHCRVHAQGTSVDLHGHGVGGVVSGSHRGRSGGLWALRYGRRMEMDARQRRGTLRGAAHRAARHSRIASVAGKQGGALPRLEP